MVCVFCHCLFTPSYIIVVSYTWCQQNLLLNLSGFWSFPGCRLSFVQILEIAIHLLHQQLCSSFWSFHKCIPCITTGEYFLQLEYRSEDALCCVHLQKIEFCCVFLWIHIVQIVLLVNGQVLEALNYRLVELIATQVSGFAVIHVLLFA